MRTIKLIFIVCFTLISLKDKAQGANFVWAQRFGGNLNDNCRSACDQSGNVYRMDIALTKHSSTGSPLWTFTPQYVPQVISFDSSGDLYVIGFFNTTIDLDHGAGTNTVSNIGGTDIAIVKLSGSNGNFIWGGTIGSTANDFSAVLFTDPSGNTFVAGTFAVPFDVNPGPAVQNFTPTGTDFFISKINTTGSLVWAKHFAGNSTSWIGSMDINASGEIYFCGNFSGTLDFDPGTATSNLITSGPSDLDMYLGKLDANGNLLWVKQMGAVGSDAMHKLELGSNGNIYCSGNFTGLVDFDSGPGTLVLNSGTISNAFVAEYNINGTPNWAHKLTDYYITAMALDQYNGLCLTGQFVNADFDPGPGTFTMAANSAGSSWPDIYISKLNSSGAFLWAKRIGSVNEDGPTTISIDGSNNIHLAGRFKTTCDFDPNSGYYPLTAAGGNFNYDAFMLKLCQTPDPSQVIGGSNLCEGQSETYSVSLLPNAQSYTWTIPSGWSGTSSTNSIVVSVGSTGGVITAKAGNSCGISPTTSLQVLVDICQGSLEQDISSEIIYPNPSTGTVYFEVVRNYKVSIYDEMGKLVQTSWLTPGKNSIELGELENGIYLLELSDLEVKKTLKLVLH